MKSIIRFENFKFFALFLSIILFFQNCSNTGFNRFDIPDVMTSKEGSTENASQSPETTPCCDKVILTQDQLGNALLFAGDPSNYRNLNVPIEQVVDMTALGADRMGIKDSTGSIQMAISSKKKVIIFPSGTYTISKNINLISDQKIIGLGQVTIKLKENATVPRNILIINNQSNIEIDNIKIDGNGNSQTNINSGEKALIQITSGSKNITLNKVIVTNGLQWGILLKGSLQADKNGLIPGVPSHIILNEVTTSNNLGIEKTNINNTSQNSTTGIAWIAGTDIQINGGVSEDDFDMEPNTLFQPLTGVVENRLFKSSTTLTGTYSENRLEVKNNTFIQPLKLPISVLLVGPYINIVNNQFKSDSSNLKKQNWIGIAIAANNTGFYDISKNHFDGYNMTAIASKNFYFVTIKNNDFNISCSDNSSVVTFESTDFHCRGIDMPVGQMREVYITENIATLNDQLSNNYFYSFASLLRRDTVEITNNTVHMPGYRIGKIYYYDPNVSYKKKIENNIAEIVIAN